MKTFARLALVVGSVALLAACGEKAEDRQIAAGLTCLDEAKSASDADVCLDKVNGLETSQAYLIRCSANFIAQGVTGKRLSDAFQKLKTNSGGSSPTSALMSYLVFRSDSTYTRHTATIAYNNCKASGVQSMVGLASIAKTAALAAGTIVPGSNLDPSSPSFDPDALKAKFQQAYTSNDPVKYAEVGELATTAQDVYCGQGSGFKDQDLCKKLGDAMTTGGGDKAAIGKYLLGLLAGS